MKKRYIVGVVSTLLIVGAGYSGILMHEVSKQSITNICITEKYRDVISSDALESGSVKSTWIVVGKSVEEGREVFEMFNNKDSIYPWKRKSSNLQARLEIKKCYNLDVTGYRVPTFSWYRNILAATPVSLE